MATFSTLDSVWLWTVLYARFLQMLPTDVAPGQDEIRETASPHAP